MSKKSKGKAQYIVQDKYFFEAKRLGYRARSAFKLLEIDEKFKILHPGMQVFDIASAPGSWLQVISKAIGPTWRVVGVDIQKIAPMGHQNVSFFQGDVFDREPIIDFLHKLEITQVDLITSDIAHATTGQTGVDQYRSIELNIAILEVADYFLKKWGNLVLKVFIGEDIDDLVAPIKQRYEKLQRIKPKACRERSFEEYFVCLGKKA